jgi:hypothetical protein
VEIESLTTEPVQFALIFRFLGGLGLQKNPVGPPLTQMFGLYEADLSFKLSESCPRLQDAKYRKFSQDAKKFLAGTSVVNFCLEQKN